MTDTVQAAQPTSSATSAITPGHSPLDILDQILKDAQTKASLDISDKAAKEAAAIEQERERQKQLDATRIQQEITKLQDMKNTPQYQAIVSQKEEAEEVKEEYDKKMDGMAIVQLVHTKL